MIQRHHFDTLDSTQDCARELIHAHHDLPFLVTADAQTAGRGRMGRAWESPIGNFYGSLALRAAVPPARYHEYSFLAALVVRGTVAEFSGAEMTLKWPNDILLDGRKCAGILIESDGMENEFLIIGIGVNLHHAPDYAAALWPHLPPDAERTKEFTQKLTQHFTVWQDRYLTNGFEFLRNAWLQHAHALGAEISVKTPVAEMSGTFNGIDTEGSLLLTQGDAEIKVRTADVRIIQ